MAVQLGSLAQPQARLDGFRARLLKAAPPTQRHLYVTAWRALNVAEARGGATLVLGDEAAVSECECLAPPVLSLIHI